jgi:hypothetical protein
VLLDNFMHPAPGDDAANYHSLAGGTRLQAAMHSLWRKLEPKLTLARAQLRYEDVEQDAATAIAHAFRALGIDPAPVQAVVAPGASGGAAQGRGFASRRAAPRWQRYRTALEPQMAALGEQAGDLGYDVQ